MGFHKLGTLTTWLFIRQHAMLQFDHNKFIFIDATFGTIDMKYHLFAMMAFYFHHIGVLVAWVITN
jgi:hypothetical protein